MDTSSFWDHSEARYRNLAKYGPPCSKMKLHLDIQEHIIEDRLYPIGSMYGIYANIWGILIVNVDPYMAYIRIRHGHWLLHHNFKEYQHHGDLAIQFPSTMFPSTSRICLVIPRYGAFQLGKWRFHGKSHEIKLMIWGYPYFRKLPFDIPISFRIIRWWKNVKQLFLTDVPWILGILWTNDYYHIVS